MYTPNQVLFNFSQNIHGVVEWIHDAGLITNPGWSSKSHAALHCGDISFQYLTQFPSQLCDSLRLTQDYVCTVFGPSQRCFCITPSTMMQLKKSATSQMTKCKSTCCLVDSHANSSTVAALLDNDTTTIWRTILSAWQQNLQTTQVQWGKHCPHIW